MSNAQYNNFVRASSTEPSTSATIHYKTKLSGEEAKRLYLEEIKGCRNNTAQQTIPCRKEERLKITKINPDDVPCKNLFVSAQNDDVSSLKNILDVYPDKLNAVDDYGWSLLMIACQANSVEAVKELLIRGIDTSIRDKAGNSARSLVIKNKNLTIADLLLNHSRNAEKQSQRVTEHEKQNESVYKGHINHKSKKHKKYVCEVCSEEYSNIKDHIKSTVHNLCASKGRKIPTNYVIPQTNKGYQIMLKVGWDRETGLGKDGSGKKYPIKAVEKKDRKGLGHEKTKCVEEIKESVKTINKKIVDRDKRRNRRFERNFRREFY